MGMAWPSTLPRPLLEGYSTTPGNEIVRTDMESGEARTRRRSVSAPDSIKLSWLLDATQMSQFRAYWDAELAGGAAWCDMSIDVGNGIEQKAVRVIGQYTALKVSAAYWKVSCEAEVRKLRSTIFDYLNLMGLPSLDLDFAGTQSLDPVITSSRQPAPVVSFSRASTATYIGADGLLKTAEANEPRFDFDPATLTCKGLLVEEGRTNVLLNSATLSTQSVTVSAVSYALSFYGTGQIVLSGAHSATVVGTGIFPNRQTLVFTPSAGSLTLTVTGSVVNAQLESGSFPTSYIPTAGASANRQPDQTGITGASFSSFYRADQGALVVDRIHRSYPLVAEYDPVYLWAGSGANAMCLRVVGGTTSMDGWVQSGGAAQVDSTNVITTAGGIHRHGFAYALNDYQSYTDGANAFSDASMLVPTVDQLTIYPSGTFHIRRIRFFPKRLPNSTLQALTA